MTCVIVGGFAFPAPAGAFDRNGFELHVARTESLNDLHFSWRVRPPFNYDAFNVRVRISDGRENQVERPGRIQGMWLERNAEAGLTYTFMVQGCDKGTFGSKCTPWSQIQFRNIRGNDAVDVGSPSLGQGPTAPPAPAAGRGRAIHELRLERTGWAQASLSAIVTNNAPAFPGITGSPLFAVVTRDGIPRIFYVGEDKHIHELRLEQTGWAQADLSAIVTNNAPAFPVATRSPLFAVVTRDGIPRIFYVGEDKHIRELRLEQTGWAQADLSAIVTNNAPAFPVATGGSPLFAVVTRDGIPRIFYVGQDKHIRELRLEQTGWAQADLSAIVTNNAPAFPVATGSSLFAVVTRDGIPRIFYVGEDKHIHELRLEQTGWAQADLSAIVTNNAPAFPAASSPLFAVVTPDGIPRIFYTGWERP